MGAGALGEIQRMQRLGGEREIRVGGGWGMGGEARKWLQTMFGSYYYIFESCSLCFFTIFVKKSEMTNLNKNFGVKRTF